MSDDKRQIRFVESSIQPDDKRDSKSIAPLVESGGLALALAIGVTAYFAGLEKAIIGIPSVVGSIIVAWAVFGSNRQQDEIKTILDMHRDYYSGGLAGKREDAIKFFKLYHSTDWVVNDPYDVSDPENKRDGYSEVLRFFHRLAILNINKRVDRQLTTDLFSRELGFWWGFAFCRMKKRSNWWTGQMVYRLARTLCEQGGWPSFRAGYRSGRKLRLYGDIRVQTWTGKVRKRPRPKSKALPGPNGLTVKTQHWL